MIDTPFFRTHPADLPPGEIRFAEALRTLQGMRSILSAAGRAELEGARAAYAEKGPADLSRLLEQVRLGPTKPGSYTFTLRVSATPEDQASLLGGEPLSRRTLKQLFRAASAAQTAAAAVRRTHDYSAFDDTIGNGVSANLCRGLSDLAGLRRRQPFEIGFRWARAAAANPPTQTIAFPEGAGTLMAAAATQLEHLAAGGAVRITGMIESLHDDPPGDDRWRIRVRGQLTADNGELDPRRSLWIRLDARSYEAALDAHRLHRPVRAEGNLQLVRRRVELLPSENGFQTLD